MHVKDYKFFGDHPYGRFSNFSLQFFSILEMILLLIAQNRLPNLDFHFERHVSPENLIDLMNMHKTSEEIF